MRIGFPLAAVVLAATMVVGIMDLPVSAGQGSGDVTPYCGGNCVMPIPGPANSEHEHGMAAQRETEDDTEVAAHLLQRPSLLRANTGLVTDH